MAAHGQQVTYLRPLVIKLLGFNYTEMLYAVNALCQSSANQSNTSLSKQITTSVYCRGCNACINNDTLRVAESEPVFFFLSFALHAQPLDCLITSEM